MGGGTGLCKPLSRNAMPESLDSRAVFGEVAVLPLALKLALELAESERKACTVIPRLLVS
jgi:hypothetical protein